MQRAAPAGGLHRDIIADTMTLTQDKIRPARKTPRAGQWWLVVPAMLSLVVFFFVPLGLLIGISFSGDTPLAAYSRLLGSAAMMKILTNTLVISAITTLACALLAVSFCLALRNLPKGLAQTALLATTLPMLISILVRTYAWLYLLAREGVVNSALTGLGLLEDPLSLLFNGGAVGIGMVHVLLPYMLLPVHQAIAGLDPQFVQAGRSLGAGPLRTFLTIELPLIWRGIVTGSILVFVLSLGFYVTPQMLGGASNTMLAMYIDVLANTFLDWPRAAAAAVMLMIGVFLCIGVLLLLRGGAGAGRRVSDA